MKLYLPLACVSLLSIGIAPTMAGEAVQEEVAEVAKATESESEEWPQQLSAELLATSFISFQ